MRKQGRKSPKVTIAYDPRNLDCVYLPSSDNRSIAICPLTPAAKTFLGKDLYEAQAYFEQETQNFELAQTQIIQSNAQFNAINNYIVEQSTEKTKDSLANALGLSNSQRLRGIRENRQIEKEVERDKQEWSNAKIDDGINSIENDFKNAEPEEYISSLSNTDKIREIRKQIKEGKD